MIGYASARYAESLAEFGTPTMMPHSGGWILQRQTPQLPYKDAIGCYPIFVCKDWSKLHVDIQNLDEKLVSLTMVPDPFGHYDEDYLHECFGNHVVPFKQHYIVDMQYPISDTVSQHHQKYARKGLERVQAEVVEKPQSFLSEWLDLHRNLLARHEIQGISRFSQLAFEKQLTTEGIVVFRALHKNLTIGAQLWFQHENVAYGHVLAFNETGYQLGATYALYWFALEHFSKKVKWCDIGGIAGLQDDQNSSLCKFKRGWSTGTKTAYLCGKILDPRKYAQLVSLNKDSNAFFPAYRNIL